MQTSFRYLLYGPRVSYARAMLDTVFPVNEPEEDIRLINPVQSIYVAPNPATDYLIISCTDLIWLEDNLQTINVIDINGKRIKSFEKTGETNTLYIGDLANGLYILELTIPQGKVSYKFIVQK